MFSAMKIAIESQRIFRSHKHGMDVVAMELIGQIQQIDHNNNYTLYAKKGPDMQCVQETGRFKIELLKGISYGDWEQFALPAALKKNNPDLVHCTANTAPLRCPVPLVLTLHDIIFLRETSFKGTAYQNFGNIYRRMVVPPAIKKAQAIITVSQEEKNIIVSTCGIDPEKVTVIHNAVSQRFFVDHNSEVIEQFRKTHQLPSAFVLHLGNTAPKKNTARMIEAYVKYVKSTKDPLPLVLVDYSRDHLLRHLAHLDASSLAKYFYLPGYIPSSDMPLLYRAASIFVYPSLLESFGLPVLEAMASGVPVITSDVPALREVGGSAAVFINPESVGNISGAIAQLLSNEAKLLPIKTAGLERASQFSWRSSAEQLIRLYTKVHS